MVEVKNQNVKLIDPYKYSSQGQAIFSAMRK